MTEIDNTEIPDEFPTETCSFKLQGPAGKLEMLVELQESETPQPAVAVICHPHSLHGGTMHNKVVHIVARALRELGLHTVRFNFRGVGESSGEFDHGNGETADLIAIGGWLRKVLPKHELWLAGFSFGSYVAAKATQKLVTKQLISVAPPVENFEFSALPRPDCPWLVVQGTEDDVVRPEAVFEWIEAMENPAHLVKMPESGHFFHRRLMDLRGLLKNSVRQNLPLSR